MTFEDTVDAEDRVCPRCARTCRPFQEPEGFLRCNICEHLARADRFAPARTTFGMGGGDQQQGDEHDRDP